jgi:hypothetical protein
MTRGRIVVLVAVVAALLADGWAYATFPVLRAIVARHHWIFYLYLSVGTGLAAAGLALAVARVSSALRLPTRS